MTRPGISVIIPTYNGAVTLARCLRAIQSSSLAPYEIIVVDDASTDNSAQIATEFGCRVLRQCESIGAARAKNVGARHATGAVLFFTDDDVVVAPNALERVAADFGDTTIEGIVGLFTPEIPFHNFASQQKNLWMLFTYEKFALRERIGLFYTSVAAIRREIFEELGGFDENYRGASIAEDTEFGQRAWRAGHRVVLDPAVRVTHHKPYTLWQVITTDSLRARALTLMRLRKLGQPFFTSVPTFYQLAVPVVFLTLAALVLFLVIGQGLLGVGSLLSLMAFCLLFTPWFAYLSVQRGFRFAFYALLFQPFDAIAVGMGMIIAVVDWARGVRY